MTTTWRRISEARLVDYDSADEALEHHLQLVGVLLAAVLTKVDSVAKVFIDDHVC